MIFSITLVYIRDSNISESYDSNAATPEFIQLYKNFLKKEIVHLRNKEFILALATGERDFSFSFRNNLVNTGTMHLVAISAFHVGIMILIFNMIFRTFSSFLPFRHNKKFFILTILKIIASIYYFFITGASIPTLRALSFILFFDIFLISGRFPHTTTLFFYSLLSVSVLIPKSAESLSFLMSALCVATVLKIWRILPNSVAIKIVTTSVVLNYILLPVSSYLTGSFPASSPIINLFVIPVVSISIPFISIAQFAVPFSKEIASFFLAISDFLISPANFIINFSSHFAEKSMIPVINPSFFIKIIFILSFFMTISFYGKIKLFSIVINICTLTFFIFNYQHSKNNINRPEALYKKAACISINKLSGRIYLDKYKYNPKFSSFFIRRMDKAASECGINNVLSIQTVDELSDEIKIKIKNSFRFRNARFYYLSDRNNLFENRSCSPFYQFHDPFL